MQSATESLIIGGDKPHTEGGILVNYNKYGLFDCRFIGLVVEGSDQIEYFSDKNDIDAFNSGFGAVWPSYLEDLVYILIPELQERGFLGMINCSWWYLSREFFCRGKAFLRQDHPAYGLRWKASFPVEKLETDLSEYDGVRLSRRE